MKLVDFAIRQSIHDRNWRAAVMRFAESLGDKEMLDMLDVLDDGCYTVYHLATGPTEIQIYYKAIVTFWQSGLVGFAPSSFNKNAAVRLYVPMV